jgi:hypothetical protein
MKGSGFDGPQLVWLFLVAMLMLGVAIDAVGGGGVAAMAPSSFDEQLSAGLSSGDLHRDDPDEDARESLLVVGAAGEARDCLAESRRSTGDEREGIDLGWGGEDSDE